MFTDASVGSCKDAMDVCSDDRRISVTLQFGSYKDVITIVRDESLEVSAQ